MGIPATKLASRRAALVVLSGDQKHAYARAREIVGDAGLLRVDKGAFRPRRLLRTLFALRSTSIDTLVFFTLSTLWQPRVSLLMALAVAAGARAVVVADASGELVTSRSRVLLSQLPRTAAELVLAPGLLLLDRCLTAVGDAVCRLRPRPRRAAGGGLSPCLYVLQTPASIRLDSGKTAHMRGFLEALDAEGQAVRVVSNDVLPSLRPTVRRSVRVCPPSSRFNLFPLLQERYNNLRLLPVLWRECQRVEPRLVYQRHARSAWAGAVVARLRGIPFVLEFNQSEVRAAEAWNGLRATRSVRRAEELCLRHATAIGVVSEELRQTLVEAGTPRERLFVNPNGVDLEAFASAQAALDGERRREALELSSRVVIGFVSTFMPYHGAAVLADAIRRLSDQSDCHFLLMGDGVDRLPLETALAAEVRERKVTFTGRVQFAELPGYLAACDLFVAPYVLLAAEVHFPNSPVKILEYMAAGRPTVASDLGQIREMLTGGAGLLVPPSDPHALAGAIGRLAGDSELRARMGAAAKQRAAERYTWQSNMERVVEALDTAQE